MMDITPEYIRRCAALPDEFTKSHEYEEGDYVFAEYTSDGQAYSKIVCIIGTKWWEGTCDPLVWLPRLDQLFDMYSGDFWSAYMRFNEWIPDVPGSCITNAYGSLEQMALSFLMYELHGMGWDATGWRNVST